MGTDTLRGGGREQRPTGVLPHALWSSSRLRIPHTLVPDASLLRHLLQHWLGRHGSKPRHDFQILLFAHFLVALAHIREYLEVIDVECWRVCVEELCFDIERVRKGMWRANGHCYVVTNGGVNVRIVWRVEAYCSLRYQEGFVVHFVPVCWRSGSPGWNCEFGAADAVVWRSLSMLFPQPCPGGEAISWRSVWSRAADLFLSRLP